MSLATRVSALLESCAAAAAETERIAADFGDVGESCRGEEAAAEGLTARWILLHLIEETARHAGHADILRESIDGASAGMLHAAGS